ncbi:dTDP-4-dehydrorhamnose reductase [Pigmentiphaga daeguensis]|uniref:dTDP-4-dehydrorhamnose reductase n=1 Tax=Pigmentiphaga daeguensis TaxID=414049 RepID=A0ABN1D5Z0_9BURK
MTILVVGAGGQVGRELILRANHGQQVAGLDRNQLDITNQSAVAEAIRSHCASVVINAAAYTAVDKAEAEPTQAFAINRDAVENLARVCAQADIPLLHLSTDYVFDGEKSTPYDEMDQPRPTSVYGQSKWEGEEALRGVLDKHIILRVSWVFGAHGNNFVRTMLRLAKDRPALRIVDDQHGGPTPASAIADVLLDIAARIVAGQAIAWGTYHYAGAPSVSWYAFGQAIFEEAHVLGLLETPPDVSPISTADYPTPARRPANSELDMTLACRKLHLSAPDWRKAVREVLTTWKHSA